MTFYLKSGIPPNRGPGRVWFARKRGLIQRWGKVAAWQYQDPTLAELAASGQKIDEKTIARHEREFGMICSRAAFGKRRREIIKAFRERFGSAFSGQIDAAGVIATNGKDLLR